MNLLEAFDDFHVHFKGNRCAQSANRLIISLPQELFMETLRPHLLQLLK